MTPEQMIFFFPFSFLVINCEDWNGFLDVVWHYAFVPSPSTHTTVGQSTPTTCHVMFCSEGSSSRCLMPAVSGLMAMYIFIHLHLCLVNIPAWQLWRGLRVQWTSLPNDQLGSFTLLLPAEGQAPQPDRQAVLPDGCANTLRGLTLPSDLTVLDAPYFCLFVGISSLQELSTKIFGSVV